MTTYLIRDFLNEKISRALDAIVEEQEDLHKQLDIELANLQKDDWSVTDKTFHAVGADLLWANFRNIVLLRKRSAARTALNEGSLLTRTHIMAIAAASLPHANFPPTDYLKKILAALDNDEMIFNELLYIMHQLWIKQGKDQNRYPFEDVGVLLPIRIETLFDAPLTEFNDNPLNWKLSIRVIPDEVSICRHNRFISEGEKIALITYWQAIQQPGSLHKRWLETDAAKVAWNILSEKVRPERAAWLVSNIEISITNRIVNIIFPTDMPEKSEPNHIGGLPKEMTIYLITDSVIDDKDHFTVGRLPMDLEAEINADNLPLPLTSDLSNQKDSWWASWEKAKKVGLGGEYFLPEGINPSNISALYVVGIGDEAPDALFTNQVNAGEMSVARLGTSTNTIHGDETDIDTDWLKTAVNRLDGRLGSKFRNRNKINKHLIGKLNGLPFYPGTEFPDETLKSRRLVSALWPALWGNWMRSIWNMGNGAYRRGLWTMENLYPEGPLMSIRISDQPYGLLPVTSLKRLKFPETTDPETVAQQKEEYEMINMLINSLSILSESARNKGTVVGKNSEEFMKILGLGANSETYSSRKFLPSSVLEILYSMDSNQKAKFENHLQNLYDKAASILRKRPQNLFVAFTSEQMSRLPLVQSTQTLSQKQRTQPLLLKVFIDMLIHFFEHNNDLEDYNLQYMSKTFNSLPDSLLIRLLVYSCQVSTVWSVLEVGDNPSLKNALELHRKQLLQIAEELDVKAVIEKHGDSETGKMFFTATLPEAIKEEWERAFSATLDSAAHRIDPWITGFAWQRLNQNSKTDRSFHRLGIYGWVDGPFMGKSGPTESGLLHTPSYNQTLAAVIMRDKFLSSERKSIVNEQGTNPWQMTIDSQKVRLAEEIAEEVRMGFHIYEILGRHIENIIGDPMKIRELRSNPDYSMRVERNDIKEVCDGHKTLPKLLNGNNPLQLNPQQHKDLLLLQDSLDTYSDLLTGDGIMKIITRQAGKAGEVMDAAAGFSTPPSFEIIQTPPSGYHLETMVISAIPFVSIESLNGNNHPIRLADPSVASFIEKKLGTKWNWKAINEDDQSEIGTVSLSMLQLSTIDTLALSDEFLRDMVRYKLDLAWTFITEKGNRRWEAFDGENKMVGSITISELNIDPEHLPEPVELNALICATLGLPTNSIIREVVPKDLRLWVVRDENQELLGLVDKEALVEIPEDQEILYKRIRQFLGLPKFRIDAPKEYKVLLQLIASLGRKPASGRDFSNNNQPSTIDTKIYSELVNRYKHLYNACDQFILKLNAANTDERRIFVLREALPWGIIPATELADRQALLFTLSGKILPKFATPLEIIVKKVSEVLTKRFNDAINPKNLLKELAMSAPIKDVNDLKKKKIPDGVPSLARAISNLASPSASLAILACWEKDEIVNNTKLVTGQQEDIEEDWLTVIATVRGTLARLEALQMELAIPMVSWTNSPGDPWRTSDDNIIKQNLEIRKTKSVAQLQMNRFVAAYGSEDSWQSNKIAAGLIDSFNEAIPMPERKTSVAFGFNAPAARAQQAILLAVPPVNRQRLNNNLLFEILEETRSLAHARTVKGEDLNQMQSLMPTMWFQGSGVPRVWLDNLPLFQ